MAGRSSRAPLYEKLAGSTSSRGTVRPRGIAVPPRDDDDADRSWLAPGRLIRVPVGFVLLTVAGIILVTVGSYMFGHRNGQSVERQRFVNDAFSDFDETHAMMEDPVLNDGEQPGGSILFNPEDSLLSGGSPTSDRRPSGTSRRTGPGAWGPIDDDPRTKGLNYFVLMQTHEDGARRLVEFCRKRGLETYAVGGHNTRLRKVVALPGFDGADRSSPAVKALESRIREIGLAWQAQEGGHDDLSGAYASLYR